MLTYCSAHSPYYLAGPFLEIRDFRKIYKTVESPMIEPIISPGDSMTPEISCFLEKIKKSGKFRIKNNFEMTSQKDLQFYGSLQ